MATTLTAPLSTLKTVFSLSYKSSVTEKSLNVTSIPAGSQDTVWDKSTSIMGQMSSCFCLHDTVSDHQARLIYELGPNQFALNWLDLHELADVKAKLLFHYDAKCARQFICTDLSPTSHLPGKFSGTQLSCDNFKEALNSIGSVQILYVPLLHYIATQSDYCELVTTEWTDATEGNVAAMVVGILRYLCHNNDILQERVSRDNGLPLLGFLLQRLPKRFVDAGLLQVVQDLVGEASLASDKDLLGLVYESLVFDFRLWNRADMDVRIGHLTYISTIIKDDKVRMRSGGVEYFFIKTKRIFIF